MEGKMTELIVGPLGHNGCPEDWRDDESCEDLMKALLKLKDDPFVMEACHLGYIHFFGDSYRRSDFAQLVRREIFLANGREAA
jgi:hypothetical protein